MTWIARVAVVMAFVVPLASAIAAPATKKKPSQSTPSPPAMRQPSPTPDAPTLPQHNLGFAAQRTTLVLGVGPAKDTLLPYGEALAAAVNETDPSFALEARATKSSNENILLLEQNKLDIALVTGEAAYEALFGIGRPPASLKIITAIHSTAGMLAVRGDSSYRSLQAMLGQSVAWGTRDSALMKLARYVLDGLGLDRDKDFKAVYLDRQGDGPAMVLDGRVAALWGGGIGWPEFTAITQAGGRLIGLSPADVARIHKKHNFLKPLVVPPGAYPNQHEIITSVGSWSYLLARPTLEESVAYRLARHPSQLQCAG